METINTTNPVQSSPVEPEPPKSVENMSPVKMTQQLKTGLAVLFLLVTLLLVTILLKSQQNQNSSQNIEESPIATESASPQPREQSAFSKTEPFMQFENKLNEVRSMTKSVDLSESALSFPLLEMKVNFQK